MKTIGKYILFLVLSMVLLTCKKYDEGGLVMLTRKHLFGGHKNGDSKTWKLKKFEVNGIDSTFLINTWGIPDFYEKFITFKLVNAKEYKYEAYTFMHLYYGTLELSTKYFTLGPGSMNKEDSTQCKEISGIIYCARDILRPETFNGAYLWEIDKLKSNALVIPNSQHKNRYKLFFEH